VGSDEYDVVVICSGNRFRSPIAEAVLREATDGLPVRVRSFGTLDLASGQALPEALELAPTLGLDLASHRSHRLAGEDLSRADLVIGFEPIHVSSAVIEAGASRERTFLLTELVERLEGITLPDGLGPVERAHAAVREADEARKASPSTPEEIADPIGGPPAGYRTSADRVNRLTRRLAELLFG
jgi:protein-tyrosine phosphatase